MNLAINNIKKSDVMIAAILAIINNEIPVHKTILRPYVSDIGPDINWPSPVPSKKTVIISCA